MQCRSSLNTLLLPPIKFSSLIFHQALGFEWSLCHQGIHLNTFFPIKLEGTISFKCFTKKTSANSFYPTAGPFSSPLTKRTHFQAGRNKSFLPTAYHKMLTNCHQWFSVGCMPLVYGQLGGGGGSFSSILLQNDGFCYHSYTSTNINLNPTHVSLLFSCFFS